MTEMNMKKKQNRGLGLSGEMNVIMICLMMICVSFCISAALKFGTTWCRVTMENVEAPWKPLLPEGVMLVAIVVCSVLIYLMLRNVRRGRVFVRSNANLIATIGILVEFAGIFGLSWDNHVYENSFPYMTSMLSITLGVFFILISCLFKVGIRMQEEQDLTV